jgi:hypothetical protein
MLAFKRGQPDAQPEMWQGEAVHSADVIVRGLDAVGTFVQRGLIPAAYILSTRSHNIVMYWNMLEGYVDHVRVTRTDPAIGKDFEYLADRAQAFIDSQGRS